MTTIAMIGGTGFVGRALIARLARTNIAVRIITRNRERHRNLLVFPQVQLIEVTPHGPAALSKYFLGSDVVINLSGILNEQGPDNFQAVHAILAQNVAEACVKSGVPRLLHMCALGATPEAPSAYLRSKAEGEHIVHSVKGVETTSFRPSVIFGPHDNFFNRFAQLLRISPGFFPLACPTAKFAPVYIEDVVEAMIRTIDDKTTIGRRYEFCGPQVYTLKELVEYTASVVGLRRVIIPLDDRLSLLQGRIMERLPGRPFSTDNYLSTKVDSITNNNALPKFDITPRSIKSILPSYLGSQRKSARLSTFRLTANRD